MQLKQIIQIERKIVIGMILNTKYLKQAIDLIDTKWVQSKEARILINWVLEYFKKYKKAPGTDIQDIYLEKLRTNKIQKKQAEIIEFILSDLSDQSVKDSINIDYLLDQTELYCKACKINLYADQVKEEIQQGNILEAEHLLTGFKPVEHLKSNAVTPLKSIQQMKDAFTSFGVPLITYPGAFGKLANPYFVPESFVVYLGQNKGGKSFMLMDAALRAAKQGKQVVFFQAGDMSQAQQERRQAIYLAQKSDLERYCGTLYIPTLDCVWNQNEECDRAEREGGANMEGPFPKTKHTKILDYPFEEIKKGMQENPNYIPCINCLRKNDHRYKGAIWYKIREPVSPLSWKEVYKLLEKRHKHVLNRIRLITYSSESLTMSKINAELDILEKSGFFPQIIVIDYLDLVAPDYDTLSMKPRDQENKKWQRARRLSQDKKCLLISASQSDADGFDKKFLSKKNFSEDRRKLDHVTAMLGLNMTREEKIKGLMRVNDIVARDTEGANWCYVMHRLQIGRPIINSFF